MPIGREFGLLRRYVREVAKQWRAILKSAVVVVVIWIAGEYGATLLARLVPLMPKPVAPWLTRNRLIVLSVAFVLAVAQYLVWRDAWLKRGTAEQPALPKGLRLKQWPSYVRGHEVPERTKFGMTASKDLRGRAIRVTCDGPIYKMDFVPKYEEIRREYKLLKGSHGREEDGENVNYNRGDNIKLTEEQAKSSFKDRVALAKDTSIPNGEPWLASGEPARKEDIRQDTTDAVIFDFRSKRLAARPFTVISGEVGSIKSIRITHVEWVEG